MLSWIDNRDELGLSKQVNEEFTQWVERRQVYGRNLSDFDTPVIGFNNARKMHDNYVAIIDQPKRFALKIINEVLIIHYTNNKKIHNNYSGVFKSF